MPYRDITDKIDYLLHGRLFEWVMTATMLGMAMQIFFFPASLESSAFYWVDISIGTEFVGLFLTVVGTVRMMALVLNGHRINGVRIGPWIRAITSVACALMWGEFAMGLARLSVNQGFPSPGIPLWLCVTFGELYSAYRALLNSRTELDV